MKKQDKKQPFLSVIIASAGVVLVIIAATCLYLGMVRREMWEKSAENITEATQQGAVTLRVQLEDELNLMSDLINSPQWLESPQKAIDTVISCVDSDAALYLYTGSGQCYPSDTSIDREAIRMIDEAGSSQGFLEPHISSNGLNVFDIFYKFKINEDPAYLIKEYNISEIADSFSLSFYNGEGFSCVMSANGRVLINSAESGDLASAISMNENAAALQFAAALSEGRTGLTTLEFNGEQTVVCCAPVGLDSGWYLTSVIPLSAVNRQWVDILIRTILLVAIIILCVSSLAALVIIYLARAAEKVRNQSKYLTHIVNTIPEGIALVSLEPPYKLLKLNPEGIRLMNFDPNDPPIGSSIEQFILPDENNASVPEKLKEISVSGKKHSFERRMLRPDGSIFWASGIVVKAQDTAGKDVLTAAFRDITAEKLAADELRLEQQQERRVLVTAISDAYPVIAGINFSRNSVRFIYLNPTIKGNIRNQTTYSGLYSDIFNRLDPDTQEQYSECFSIEKLQSRLGSGLNNIMEFRALMDDGMHHWMSMQVIGVDSEPSGASAVCLIRRVDRERAAEEKRRQVLQTALEEAEAANNSKSRFLANVTHDFRTPMNIITSMTSLLITEELTPEKTAEYLNTIRLSSQHMLNLINNILNMEEIEKGGLVLHNIPFSFSRLVSETAAMVTPEAETKGVTLTTEIKALEKAVVIGDIIRLRQAYLNILSNAVKYTNKGGSITVEAELLPTGTEGVLSCVLRCSDTGIGMSEEFIQRLFEPFERADSSVVFQTCGNGLGMAITHNIISRMGGKIDVSSVLGKGSVFTVTVSLAAVPDENYDADADDVDELSEDECITSPDLTGRHILFADDNSLNCTIAEALLSETNVDITTAVNGREAFELFAASQPGFYSMVMLDINMPQMDGFEAARAIRSLNRTDAETVPIVFVSAYSTGEIMQRCEEAGMTDILAKPYEPDKIFAAMEKYILHV